MLCAISYSAKRLGAAIYDEEEKEVRILSDVAEDDDFIMLSRFLRETKPENIIANRSQDAEYQMFLRRECNHLISEILETTSDKTGEDLTTSIVPDSQNATLMMQTQTQQISETITDNQQQPEPQEGGKDEVAAPIWRPSINFLPDITFSFGHARKKLEQVFGDGVKNELLASFRFDFSATNMIRSLGALLRFMEQQNAGPSNKDQQQDSTLRSSIEKLSIYVIPDCIEVDLTTLRALEIFYSAYTPRTVRKKFVWGNNRREGMSIFKLCNLCRSSPGKQMLRMWFERPSKDIKMLTERHDAIAFLYQDCNLEITAFLRNFMKDITAVKGILRRMRRGNLPVSDWKNFYTTICTLTKIGTCMSEREVDLAIFRGKLHSLGDRIQRVAGLLIEVIDFKETLSENRLVTKKGLDEELDKKKELYEKLPDELTAVASMEADELNIEGCSVAYVPILGYLLMAQESIQIHTTTGTLIELIYTSEGMSYYKTKRMRLLDENVGDIKMQIVDAETSIVLNLLKRLLNMRQLVLEGVEVAATLDCLISLAMVARKYNWIRPKFVDKPVLKIEQARHPIAEHLCGSSVYVSNPILSSEQIGKVKVLFGPNASGKSVYLKMVGAVVYMACVGCFVPAQSAVIGPINRIMSRLYTVDSVLDGMSSFANDLKQMSRAIARSDENSLLIIDEFGKGTMTEVGLSLLASCLNYWLEGPPEKCPHVVVASHFHALPELLNDPANLLRFQTMGVTRLDDDTLNFHFNLVDGMTDLSYATYTALKMGIAREVVDRSEEVYTHLRAGGTLAELEPIPIPQLEEEEEHLSVEKYGQRNEEEDEDGEEEGNGHRMEDDSQMEESQMEDEDYAGHKYYEVDEKEQMEENEEVEELMKKEEEEDVEEEDEANISEESVQIVEETILEY